MSSLIKQQLLLQQQQQLQQQQLLAARSNRASLSLLKKTIPRSPFYSVTSTKRYDLLQVGDVKDETYVILEEPIDGDFTNDVNSELYEIAFLVNQMVFYVSYQFAQEITRDEMEELEKFEQECWMEECEKLEAIHINASSNSTQKLSNTSKKKGMSKSKSSKKAIVTGTADDLPPLFYDPIMNVTSDVLLKKPRENVVQFSYSIPLLGSTSNTSGGMLNKRLSEIANMLAETIKREKREKKN
ncbi:hypothetical protein C9374_013354 [Naegleria lovaniensis]|uniref:Uncharacterized protein n=1 Tax=Naegleria lovaniensis TaxID=51637 RepID=A0AA88KQK3_NAELO|nr:uncharacterized protein C9374_013354 [Naegleria lovaniensis]KAG2391869.1 hypothetical protein C9374_013354 [Naegleria lovaniensis]